MPQELNSVEQLRLWFRKCPAILDTNRFNVDYLNERATEYAIYSVPSTLKYHENIIGEMILDDTQTQNFIFASKASFGADIQQNLANLGFYDEVAAWVLEQNNAQSFPSIREGTVKSIVPTLTAYPAEVGSDAAKYQIQLKMTYRRY